MGIYLRKSVTVGPLRFNLSGQGVGVSAGVRGLRIGTGPRGHYVHLGTSGVYYRQSLSPGDSARPTSVSPTLLLERRATHEPLRELESADVSALIDSSSDELLAELKAKRLRSRLWPLVLSLGLVLMLGIFAIRLSAWLQAAAACTVIWATWAAWQHDLLAKTTVLGYSLEGELEDAYEALHDAALKLASSDGLWYVAASAWVLNRKYHAGANTL